ncbi:MAG: polyprenyl synthetase family protein [Ruminococcus sp.]|nr:polyprenyl synthetase family protein [Ruminococcus sp.]
MNHTESREKFQKRQKEKVEQIEEILREYLPEKSGYQQVIMEAMEYSLLAGGKRLRPMLLMESYRLCGGKGKEVEPFMAALEMIHTYSLVHDDLPAMDNDAWRRGRQTTHVVYGEDMGILAGDALLNYAFETACSAFSMEGADAGRIGKALEILACKAGIYGMIGGQVVDVQSSGTKVSGEKLQFIYRLKTGALIEAAMMIGAVLAGAAKERISVLESIAGDVGLAFQIQDDILDVTGTEETLGKPVHSDEKNEKTTYVTWKGVKAAREEVELLSQKAVKELQTLEPQDDYLEMLLIWLIHREK